MEKKFKVTDIFDKGTYDKRVKAYEGYFVDSPDKELIVVFSINLK